MTQRIAHTTALLLALLAPALGAQSPVAKPATRTADWAKWETLGNGELSPDGIWVAYDLRRANGASELRYRLVATDSERVVRNGTGAAFSSDGRWLLYAILPDTAGRAGRDARGAGAATPTTPVAPARNKVGIVDLRTGATLIRDDIQSFTLSKGSAYVALRRYAVAGRKSRGTDLIVRDLAQGTEITMGNVAELAWTDDGALLGMLIDVDGKAGNGVQVLDVTSGAIRSLDGANDALYANLTWRARSRDLAVLRTRVDSAFVDTSQVVIALRDVGTTRASRKLYDFTTDKSFPPGMRVAGYRRPMWSDDGSVLLVGIAPREPKAVAADRGSAATPARVEVWHWKDQRQYHQQDRQAAQDRAKTHLVAWHLNSDKLVRLTDDAFETLQLADNRTVGLATDDAPYFAEALSGRAVRDVYVVDVASGAREKIVTKSASGATLSPSGRYALYFQDGQWWTYDITTRARANLTANTHSVFANMEDDHPLPEPRPYGGAGGWTKGEKSVFLHDRFDVWQVNTNGSKPVRLTRGKEDSTVYRVVRLNAAGGRGGGGGFGAAAEPVDVDDRFIDPAKPILLSATGEFTRKSGYSRVTLGNTAQRLVWRDKAIARVARAKNADVYLFEQQSHDDSPDFFVGGAALADAKQVSHTNAFQSDYAWSRQELLPYTNSRGDKLQMMLTYPANYDPSRKYPMVVYYYEKVSQGFHQYVVPSERATYNTTVFAQNGYFVLRPDVVFQPRDPGFSGLDCVSSAVKALLATGMVDAQRVGNMGHSWGGYQSAFYAVHGKGMFAATIAGAPLTNFVSFYGYTSFNTGLPETGHFETGQERMQVSLWDDPQAYIRNSTVFAVDSLKTPLLLEEGDADGNVNYWQSTELYNFGRRLGKPVVYLIYNDENHGVARPESQIDYHRRQLEWFNHYLKGEPAASWITDGETYLTRQKLLKDGAPATTGTIPIRIETSLGVIDAELDSARAPATVANFLRYVDARLYDNGSFFRVVRPDNQPSDSVRIEVIQGGVAKERRAEGFPAIALERTSVTALHHDDGTLSMARGGPDSATDQFFITFGAQPELDFGGRRNKDGQGFAAFGRVTSGLDVARAIQRLPAQGQALAEPVVILRITRR